MFMVNINNIYVGEVVKVDKVFKTYDNKLDVDILSYYRSILFSVNKNIMSNDLLYSGPRYPILNITADDICLNLKRNSVVVRNSFNLSMLLKYFGYGDELSYLDIVSIYKTFFDGKFPRDNCKLFGFKKVKNNSFDYVGDNVLPSDYFYMLIDMGNKSLFDILFGYANKINAFKPAKIEGRVRKIIR